MRLRSVDHPKDLQAEPKPSLHSLTGAITPRPLPSPTALAGTRSYCPLFGTATHASAQAELDTLQTA
ncbi:hypothetical protein CesoFtcFv8_017249 [Champsocephalus esox]|uniref:Uncharacterized protein n=1 Tax=Champsocephalus esox TaxID=159716 RepID=A0AAN8GQ27_9TELE|nr:hypothetical protein CesoFtcFv8_017249 [Champsocephalus esox]